MFNLNEYVGNLVVQADDEELQHTNNLVELVHLCLDDPWLTRQGLFGLAGAMERQITYLGSTLKPSAEQKLNVLSGSGFLSESDVSQARFANEDKPHINDELSVDQRVGDQQDFIDQLDDRMRRASIMFVKCVRAHDAISFDLNQMSYDGIKAKADSNRKAREQQTFRGTERAQGVA